MQGWTTQIVTCAVCCMQGGTTQSVTCAVCSMQWWTTQIVTCAVCCMQGWTTQIVTRAMCCMQGWTTQIVTRAVCCMQGWTTQIVTRAVCCMQGWTTQIVTRTVCCMQGSLHGMQRDNLPVYNGSVRCPSWQLEVTKAKIWVNSDGTIFMWRYLSHHTQGCAFQSTPCFHDSAMGNLFSGTGATIPVTHVTMHLPKQITMYMNVLHYHQLHLPHHKMSSKPSLQTIITVFLYMSVGIFLFPALLCFLEEHGIWNKECEEMSWMCVTENSCSLLWCDPEDESTSVNTNQTALHHITSQMTQILSITAVKTLHLARLGFCHFNQQIHVCWLKLQKLDYNKWNGKCKKYIG